MNIIPDTFLTYASDVLADSFNGFTTSQVIKLCSAYSVQYNVNIPHSKMPPETPNKRTALLENLQKFTPEQQYAILDDMCRKPSQCNREEVKELHKLLKQRYGMLNKESVSFDQALSADTGHWLSNYPDALKCYNDAINKRRQGLYERNLLDDLRLALELLLKSVLNNDKSLENQISILGSFIANKGGTKEFRNMFLKLIDYFAKYQDEHVKHNDKVAEMEIDFIVDITSAFMKCICRIV